MARWLFAVCSTLCVLLLVGGIVGPIGATPAHVVSPTSLEDSPPESIGAAGASFVDDNFTSTDFVITVYANQSIQWTFEHRTPLSSESRREWFEAYAETFNRNETDAYDEFRRRARALVANARSVTGRQMNASNFRKTARVSGITDNLGVVRMSFTWSNFTRRDGDRLVMADVFRNGLYIGPNQSLVVDRGSELAFQSADPQPDSTAAPTLTESVSVTWEGERDFNDFRPRLVFRTEDGSGGALTTTVGSTPTADTPTETAPTVTTSTTPGGPPGGDGQSPSEGNLLLTIAVVLFAVVFLAVALLAVWLYRNEMLPATISPDRDDGATADSDVNAEPEPVSTATGVASESEEVPDDGSPTPAREEDRTDQPDVSAEQFRTDEDWVISILEDEGGRMKQSAIVEETDWSKSKVSMLLSNMEEEGDISKLRVGRENIISLPGKEPDAAGSPFEDEDT